MRSFAPRQDDVIALRPERSEGPTASWPWRCRCVTEQRKDLIWIDCVDSGWLLTICGAEFHDGAVSIDKILASTSHGEAQWNSPDNIPGVELDNGPAIGAIKC